MSFEARLFSAGPERELISDNNVENKSLKLEFDRDVLVFETSAVDKEVVARLEGN